MSSLEFRDKAGTPEMCEAACSDYGAECAVQRYYAAEISNVNQ